MAETTNKKKPERTVHPAVREFDNTRTYIATTSAGKGAPEAFEILWPVPQVAEGIEAMEKEAKRYGGLQNLVLAGVKEISHGPAYNTLFEGWAKDKKPVDHAELQKLADTYVPGQRKVGAQRVTKAKADKVDKLAEAGIDINAILADPEKAAKALAKLGLGGAPSDK